MLFSELRVKREMKIVNGKAELVENEVNGNIKFTNINTKLAKQINEEVVQKLSNKATDEEIAYKLFPYLTDLTMDVNLNEFLEIMSEPSELIIILYSNLMKIFEDLINLSSKTQELTQRAESLNEKLPSEKEIYRNKLNELYVEFEKEKDTKKRNEIINDIIQIKNKLGD